MKKIFMATLIILVLITCSGVWAQDSTAGIADANITNAETDVITSAEDETNNHINDEIAVADSKFGTFTELNNLIGNATGSLTLDKDYMYNPLVDHDYESGVDVDRDICIYGNNHTIYGNGARIMWIYSSHSAFICDLHFVNPYVYDDLSNDTLIFYSAGGAIYNNGNLHLESCTFTGNLAGYGGAVYSSNRSSLHVSNCNFTNNLAVHNGGAISNNGTACIGESPNGENCIFSGNAANDDGGAIYSSNDLTLYDSSFKNNYAQNGGAIYNVEGSYINDCVFENNTASGYGGATCNAVVEDSVFSHNNAENATYGCDMYMGVSINCKSESSTGVIVAEGLTTTSDTLQYSTTAAGNIFRAVVTSESGNETVPGIKVALFLDSGENYTAISGSDGQASFTLPALANGTHIFTVALPNFKSEKTYMVNVSLDSRLIMDDIAAHVGDEITITANVTNPDGITVNDGHVTFFDGKTYIGKANVTNGIAKICYIPASVGEYEITAVFTSSYFISSNDTALIRVSKAKVDLSIQSIAGSYINYPISFQVTATSSSRPVKEGGIRFYVNETFIGASAISDGVAGLSYIADAKGPFILTVLYDENDNYLPSNATFRFYVERMPTALSGESVFYDGEGPKTFTAVLKDGINNGICNQSVFIEAVSNYGQSRTFAGTSDINGAAVFDVSDLGGMWSVRGVYDGNDNYTSSGFTDSYIIICMNTTTSIEEIGECQIGQTLRFKANVVDEHGRPVSEGIVKFYLNGAYVGSLDLSRQESNGSVSDSFIEFIPSEVGMHTISAVYEGTTICRASNSTAEFKVTGPTQIIASGVVTVFNGGKYLLITLKDSKGNALSGARVSVVLNGKTYNPATDKNGQVRISTNNLAPVKTYVAKIAFNGNEYYLKSAKQVKVIVKKATPKLIAKSRAYKLKAAKRYYVTLRTNQNRVMKNSIVTLKIGRMTWNVKTNAKGVASFNLYKLSKKGNFKAIITYRGNSYYNRVAKAVYVRVV